MPSKSSGWILCVHDRISRTPPSHVSSSLKKMIKNVQVTGDTIDEDDLDEAVGMHFTVIPDPLTHSLKVARAREQHEKEFADAPKKEVCLSITAKCITRSQPITG